MAAVWPTVGEGTGPEVAERRDKLRRWFWCATFAQRYETQGNTRTQNDVPTLVAWLTGVGPQPDVMSEGELRSFRTVSSPTQALYNAALALSCAITRLTSTRGSP